MMLGGDDGTCEMKTVRRTALFLDIPVRIWSHHILFAGWTRKRVANSILARGTALLTPKLCMIAQIYYAGQVGRASS